MSPAAKKASKKAAKKVAKAAGGPMTAPAEGVKVRMYRTGLGDCFLLAFPRKAKGKGGNKAFYLLIDCGVYFRTPQEGNAPRIRRIVEDIRDATGGFLDVLVITHEHWDHVSAFHPSQAQSIFEKQIGLGTLWMAWTENLDIPLARDLNEGRKAARHALAEAVSRMQGAAAAQSDTCGLVCKVLDFFGGPAEGPAVAALGAAAAKKSVQTEEAMHWLRDVYGKGKTKFLHPCDGPLALDGVPEARIYVLGPPEDRDLIKRTDPRGDEVYPKAMAALEASFFAAFGVVPASGDAVPDDEDVKEAQRMSLPFDGSARIEETAAKGDPFFKATYFSSDQEWRKIDADWLEAAGQFALQLDNATNNTSLALAIEVGAPGEGKVLLFPGDAQVGNWLSWFGKVSIGKRELGREMEWKAGSRKVTAEDLLRRTAVYKVGHHGSHNATLRAKGLELMGHAGGGSDLVAFLPVDEHVARDLAHYGEMPLRSLVKDLAIRTGGRVARSDEGQTSSDPQSTLRRIPGAPPLSSDFVDEVTDLYFEYTVKPG